MRFAERQRLREENEAKLLREEKKRKRNWKRIAGLPAFCYSCKKQMTYAELFVYNPGRKHPHGKENRCEKCFMQELNDMDYGAGSESYAGEDIFWRLG